MTEEFLPCPFCGSCDLAAGAWCLDDEEEEVQAIECNTCYGAAPVRVWNDRVQELNEEVEENAKLRSTLMAAEQSLAIYVGIYGYQDGVEEILRQVSETLEDSQ